MSKFLLYLFVGISIVIAALIVVVGLGGVEDSEEIVSATIPYSGYKVLYIDSYHEGYEWSDSITKGVRDVFEGTGVELKIYRMDTKRNGDEEFKVQAGLDVKKIIEEFNPDVLLVSDDNAFKYLVMPYYKDVELPVVFCGLNWDASLYGAPYSNTAGMVEVALIPQLLGHLTPYVKGDKIGYFSADTLTSRKEGEYYKKFFNLDLTEVYVKTLDEWKTEFVNIQEDVDILIIGNNAGIDEWDDDEMKSFSEENVAVPVGAIDYWMTFYSLIGFVKVPEEQGEWSAKAALRILDGESPSDVGVVENKKGNIILNIKHADKLGIEFDSSLLKVAETVYS